MKTFLMLLFLLGFGGLVRAQGQVTHMVMFKLKTGVLKSDERYVQAVQLAKKLPDRIRFISDYSAGENFSTRPIAYDFGLVVILESKKDLQEYLLHPAHVEVANKWKEIADWHIVDFEETGD